jgi:hypothetical protein
MARAAYLRICTVSSRRARRRTSRSSVYMSMAWRCISSSLSAATASAPSRRREAWRSRKESTSRRSRPAPARRTRRGRPTGRRAAARPPARRSPPAGRAAVQGVAQRCAPALVPAGLSVGAAAAVALPALQAVGAAPARALDGLRLPLTGTLSRAWPRLTTSRSSRGGHQAQRLRQRALEALAVVAEGLAVHGDDQHLVVAAVAVEAPLQHAHDVLAAREVAPKASSRAMGRRREDGDLQALAEPHAVGRVGSKRARWRPASRRRGGGPASPGTARGRCSAARRGPVAQRLAVGAGLGQPEALGLAAEAGAEVGQAPADLGAPVRELHSGRMAWL